MFATLFSSHIFSCPLLTLPLAVASPVPTGRSPPPAATNALRPTETVEVLALPIIDEKSYIERIVYRLKEWAGVQIEPEIQGGKEGPPHPSALCKGCKWVYCKVDLDNGSSYGDPRRTHSGAWPCNLCGTGPTLRREANEKTSKPTTATPISNPWRDCCWGNTDNTSMLTGYNEHLNFAGIKA